MTTLELIEFRLNIENYIDSKNLPSEVVRMVLEQILAKVNNKVSQEFKDQLAEREKVNE